MIIGLIAIIILSWFIICELMVIYHNNPEAMNKKRKEEEIEPEARLCATRALTLAGLTFAGIIFLITNYKAHYEDALCILVYSFGLLLLSYNFEILTGDKELFFQIQDKLLKYGFLGLILSLLLFFWNILKIISFIILIFVIAFIILHLMESKITLEGYRSMK
ncbi:MAG: hypothetical protein H5T50_08895 [Nitrososphaeria archaeon]|nr:hypothetical protein [Nitrososphaeria archaeon]